MGREEDEEVKEGFRESLGTKNSRRVWSVRWVKKDEDESTKGPEKEALRAANSFNFILRTIGSHGRFLSKPLVGVKKLA